jgi:thiamine biosynthesis lipoprotein
MTSNNKHLRTKTKYAKLPLTILLIVCMIASISGCSALTQKSANLSYTDQLFDTIITVEILDKADKELIDGVKLLCQNYDKQFSKTHTGGDIYRINHSNGQPTKVSDDTIDIITKGIEYGEISGGLFDITIAPLSNLWNLKSANFKVPDDEDIAEAKSHVNYKNIQIEGNYVTLLDPKSGIDLGGIAKGYIADRIKEFLIENEVEHAFINLGGNVLALGAKLDGSEYNIGIQKPFDKTGEVIDSVKMFDESVVTSGIYERYKRVNGTIYHHIIDPRTGYPCDNNLYSTTIITPSSTAADVYSTTTFLMGYTDGSKFIEQQKNVAVIFVTDDNHIHKVEN